MNNVTFIELQGFRISIFNYQFQEYKFDEDAGWLNTKIEFKSEFSNVKLTGPYLQTQELEAFTSSLEYFLNGKDQNANMVCLEPALAIKILRDARDQIIVYIDLVPSVPDESHTITLYPRKNELESMLNQCNFACKKFPNRFSKN